METGQSDTIQLTLDVGEPIRGKTSGAVEVSTTLPHECGVRANLGRRSLYVIGNSSEPVTRCGGSGSHNYREGHELDDLYQLVFALITIEYADRDPQVVQTWLDRMYRKGQSSRDKLQSLFTLIGEIDIGTVIIETDNEVIYRNMVFVFTDDVLIDYFWKDGAS